MTCVVQGVLLYLFIFIGICVVQSQAYEVPDATIEALDPRGFRVSLKDDNYTLFVFRANINKPLQRPGDAEIKYTTRDSKGGLFLYKNLDVQLKINDIINYWTLVIKDEMSHINSDLAYIVTEFVKENTPIGGRPILPTSTNTTNRNQNDSLSDRYNPDCTISKTTVQGRASVCTGDLIFNEEFDSTSLSQLKNWDALIQFVGEPDYPFNLYIPDNTVSFEEGSLVITPVLTESQRSEGFLHQSLNLGERCTGKADTTDCSQEASGSQILPPVTTAKITSRRTFNFMFGRVEVRAKLPLGSWLIPEINLEPTDNAYGPNNYESGLMRVAYVRGNSALAKKLYGGPVLSQSEPFRSTLLSEKIGIDNWHKEFHNYSMVWRPDGMDLLVDGEQYGTVFPGGGFFEVAKVNKVAHASHWQRGTVMAPLDKMFHLTLGLRVGGISDFSDDLEGKPWRNGGSKAMFNFWKNKDTWYPSWSNNALKVDFVKVYAL